MFEDGKIDLTEAVEAGCRAVAKDGAVDWETQDEFTKLSIREMVRVPLEAGLPFIIDQVLNSVDPRL